MSRHPECPMCICEELDGKPDFLSIAGQHAKMRLDAAREEGRREVINAILEDHPGLLHDTFVTTFLDRGWDKETKK